MNSGKKQAAQVPATQQPTYAPEKKNADYLSLLNGAVMKEKILQVLPSYLDPSKFLSMAIAAAKSCGRDAEVVPASILLAVFDAASLGLSLNPLLGHAHLIPFRMKLPGGQKAKVCQLIPGYKGMIHLAKKSGGIKDIKAFVVYENDEYNEWRDDEGSHYIHRPAKENRGKMISAYCLYWLSVDLGDKPRFHPVSGNKITRIKNGAVRRGGAVWKSDDEEDMWLKTAIKQALKTADISPEVNEAITRDDMASVGKMSIQSADLSGVISESELKLLENAKMEDEPTSTKPEITRPVQEVLPETKPAETKKPEAVKTPTAPEEPALVLAPAKAQVTPETTPDTAVSFRSKVLVAINGAGLTPEQGYGIIEDEFGFKGTLIIPEADQKEILEFFARIEENNKEMGA